MKKTLALTLALIMVLCMLPSTAFAKSEWGKLDFGKYMTISYRHPNTVIGKPTELSRKVKVEVYVNYEKIEDQTKEITDIAVGGNNFKIKQKEGYFYGNAANNHDCINATYDGTTLGFNLFDKKTATIKIYLFTFRDGVNVDFTRYLKNIAGNWDEACDTLKISYTHDGVKYEYDYTKWDQTHTTYVPKAHNIYVDPVIKDGYHVKWWITADALGDGANRLYNVDENGNTSESKPEIVLPGIGSFPNKPAQGSYATTKRMAFYFGAGGFDRFQIALFMEPNNVEQTHEHKLIYDANGGTGAPGIATSKTTDTSHTFTVSDTEPTRVNYTFLGWADAANATEARYTAGSGITVSGTKTIYAVWKMNAPEAPDHDKLKELVGTGKIKVQCMTDSIAHPVAGYDLKENSYNKSTVTLNESGVFTCTVTVRPGEYVKEYNNTYNGHTLDPDTQAYGKPVTFVWDTKVEGENKWVLADQPTVPVVFTVKHATTVPGSVSAVTKTRLKEVPAGVILPENVTINKEEPVIFTDNNTSATLLYKFTVTGTPSAEVEIKDDGATFINNGINGNPSYNNEITVTLPAAVENETETSTTVYGYRTFSVDDIQDGKLVNNATANVTNGDPNNDKTGTEDVPALDNRTLNNTLTVEKLVSGNAADPTEKFLFKATFTFPVPGASATPDGVTSGESVEIDFELAHNQTKTFSYTSDQKLQTMIDGLLRNGTVDGTGDNVFAMLSYKVEETNAKGYTLATSGDAEGNAAGHNTVTFTNTKNKPNDDHGGHWHPTTPVPVIVIPPKTGDMTVWQSILHFLGIR